MVLLYNTSILGWEELFYRSLNAEKQQKFNELKECFSDEEGVKNLPERIQTIFKELLKNLKWSNNKKAYRAIGPLMSADKEWKSIGLISFENDISPGTTKKIMNFFSKNSSVENYILKNVRDITGKKTKAQGSTYRLNKLGNQNKEDVLGLFKEFGLGGDLIKFFVKRGDYIKYQVNLLKLENIGVSMYFPVTWYENKLNAAKKEAGIA